MPKQCLLVGVAILLALGALSIGSAEKPFTQVAQVADEGQPAAGPQRAPGRQAAVRAVAGLRRVMNQLTPEQRDQLMAKIKDMRAKNATPEEIKLAVKDMLQGWGIKLPERQPERQPWWRQLTADQQKELKDKVAELLESSTPPERIGQAIAETLKGWGIEPIPGRQGIMAGLPKLTEEQRKQVQAKVKDMRAQGAKPQEIRAAVKDMLKGWGIELPQQGGRGALLQQLTPDQRQQLQAKVKELRGRNATREEIRTAVQEMLKGWGVELPQGRGKAGEPQA
ncbi:MAG: hypothetical protein HPY69_15395 [Armatimonadetes bacterium]|nr:hypothetical protein [Armatimonadota bacterium]